MPPKQYIRYTEAFKQKIVEDTLKYNLSLHEAGLKYSVSDVTIKNWIVKFGKENRLPKGIVVSMHSEIKNEKEEIKRLKERVRHLEKALADEKIRSICGEAQLEVIVDHLAPGKLEELKKNLKIDQ